MEGFLLTSLANYDICVKYPTEMRNSGKMEIVDKKY